MCDSLHEGLHLLGLVLHAVLGVLGLADERVELVDVRADLGVEVGLPGRGKPPPVVPSLGVLGQRLLVVGARRRDLGVGRLGLGRGAGPGLVLRGARPRGGDAGLQ